MKKIFAIRLSDRPPVFPALIEISSDELDKYPGEYSSSDLSLKISVTKKDSTLYAQIAEQQELPLEYIGNNRFQCESVDAILEFIPEKNNLVLKQLGVTYSLFR